MGSAIVGLHTHSTLVSKQTREVVTETRMVLWKPRHPRQCLKSRGLAKNQEAKQRSMNHYYIITGTGEGDDPRICSQWLVVISPFWWNIFECFQVSKVLAGENISPRRFSDMAWCSFFFLQRGRHKPPSFLGAMYQNEGISWYFHLKNSLNVKVIFKGFLRILKCGEKSIRWGQKPVLYICG